VWGGKSGKLLPPSWKRKSNSSGISISISSRLPTISAYNFPFFILLFFLARFVLVEIKAFVISIKCSGSGFDLEFGPKKIKNATNI